MVNKDLILTAADLTLGYQKGRTSKNIAENISFHLERGKLTCLLGPNGVGKSTLIKTILCQLPPITGKIILNGKEIKEYGIKEISQKIAVVLTEKIRTGTLTVRQLVELGRIPHTGWLGKLSENDEMKVRKAIEATNIQYLVDTPLSELSDGQLQKAMISRALAQDGEILILDEPTAHLDLVNRFEIMHLLRKISKEENKAVLVTTHDLEIAIETADEFWLMQCGLPLITGLPEDLIIRQQLDILLPTENLKFNKISGKVQALHESKELEMEESNPLTQWLTLALRKRNLLPFQKDIRIKIKEEPFIIEWKNGDNFRHFFSIESFLIFLKTNKE
ncbi:ABC transporter ATP-binding protein [Shivajiella indica]|uniref:ABC transporter ATP-binding protein n=1 Tax=Shivajiella indica TaxID=872115 RepID=A0ABW5BBX7_9BACT